MQELAHGPVSLQFSDWTDLITVERPHELVYRLTDAVEGLAGVEKKLTEAVENLDAESKLPDEVALCEWRGS